MAAQQSQVGGGCHGDRAWSRVDVRASGGQRFSGRASSSEDVPVLARVEPGARGPCRARQLGWVVSARGAGKEGSRDTPQSRAGPAPCGLAQEGFSSVPGNGSSRAVPALWSDITPLTVGFLIGGPAGDRCPGLLAGNVCGGPRCSVAPEGGHRLEDGPGHIRRGGGGQPELVGTDPRVSPAVGSRGQGEPTHLGLGAAVWAAGRPGGPATQGSFSMASHQGAVGSDSRALPPRPRPPSAYQAHGLGQAWARFLIQERGQLAVVGQQETMPGKALSTGSKSASPSLDIVPGLWVRAHGSP